MVLGIQSAVKTVLIIYGDYLVTIELINIMRHFVGSPISAIHCSPVNACSSDAISRPAASAPPLSPGWRRAASRRRSPSVLVHHCFP